jgi:hypothetical protein
MGRARTGKAAKSAVEDQDDIASHISSNRFVGILGPCQGQRLRKGERVDMATVREVTFDLLRELGMRTVFGNPGSTELPFLGCWGHQAGEGEWLLDAKHKTDARKKVQQTVRSVLPNETEATMVFTETVRAPRTHN